MGLGVSALRPHDDTSAPSFQALETFLTSSANRLYQPIMTKPTCSHPSRYATSLKSPSTCALIGTTTPCRTGRARIGVLRLGNKVGRRACIAVPSVCGSFVPCKKGEMSDWTTRKWPVDGSEADGEEGR